MAMESLPGRHPVCGNSCLASLCACFPAALRLTLLPPAPCPCSWQAVEAEAEHADQAHASERQQHQQTLDRLQQQLTEWKVQCFDAQYER